MSILSMTVKESALKLYESHRDRLVPDQVPIVVHTTTVQPNLAESRLTLTSVPLESFIMVSEEGFELEKLGAGPCMLLSLSSDEIDKLDEDEQRIQAARDARLQLIALLKTLVA